MNRCQVSLGIGRRPPVRREYSSKDSMRMLITLTGRVGQRSATHRDGCNLVGCTALTHPTNL